MYSFSSYILENLTKTAKKIALAILVFFILPSFAFGASLAFSPSSGIYQVGSTLTVGIVAGSPDKPINALSGVVNFPSDKLEVVSISKNQSIISLWVQEPTFSNAEGTINFEGIVLNPGFQGNGGRILNVTFKTKSDGATQLAFIKGSILANDGEGTEILTSKGTAQFSFTPITIPPIPDSLPSNDLEEVINDDLLVPVVNSKTHPLNSWSNLQSGEFEFDFSAGVTAIRLLLDTKPTSNPIIVYSPPIESKTISDLEEGVSYLHVQYKDATGWSEILHYKIQTDTKVPDSFVIKEVVPGLFLFEAKDSHSGISRYEVQIDGGEMMPFVDDGSHIYKVPEQIAGQHVLSVRAYDAAGNFIVATLPFVIENKLVETPPVMVAPVEEQTGDGFLVPKGAILITALSIIIPTVALILLLCFMLYSMWQFVGGLKMRINKEVKEASLTVHKAFMILKMDLEVDIETLKKANLKRKLTREEAKILKRLEKNLNEAELAINKEIADIDKEVSS